MTVRYIILAAVVLLAAFRVWRRVRRGGSIGAPPVMRALSGLTGRGGQSGLVAAREVRERFRSRVFRVGTILVILVVAAAIVIPVLRKGHHSQARVGVVGTLSAPLQRTVVEAGAAAGVTVVLVPQASVEAAEAALRSGDISLAIDGTQRLLVKQALSATDTSANALAARTIASALSLQAGLEAAGIPPAQAATLARPTPLPIVGLEKAAHNQTQRATTVYGLILIFILLSQYGTWILMGVVEEKSSRVVEVLLATMRPVQLLTGKVIGIGTVALAQAGLLVAIALGLAAAVGSDLVHGSAPIVVVSILIWLVLGYGFYCWVYAAGGSLADRQEHLQTLAFPLQIPILIGYIVSLSSVGSSNPSLLIHVLAYLPPTAPFAMTLLVGLGKATWWQFAISAGLSILATIVVARFAALVYSRAVLRTGKRLHLREVLATAG
jgi:ABC-2 type transport system permease protein